MDVSNRFMFEVSTHCRVHTQCDKDNKLGEPVNLQYDSHCNTKVSNLIMYLFLLTSLVYTIIVLFFIVPPLFFRNMHALILSPEAIMTESMVDSSLLSETNHQLNE